VRNDRVSRALVYIALGIVAVVVVWAFTLVGGPTFNRMKMADKNRIEDLSRISTDVDTYFQEQDKLPEKLSDLEKLRYSYRERNLVDSITKKPYQYEVLRNDSYKLCSEFDLTSKEAEMEKSNWNYQRSSNWEHPAGPFCFEFTIPERKKN
jgi:hypothetical protein